MYCRAHKTATLTPIQHTVPLPPPHTHTKKFQPLKWMVPYLEMVSIENHVTTFFKLNILSIAGVNLVSNLSITIK